MGAAGDGADRRLHDLGADRREQRRISVRAPRSAHLMSALTVVRMLDPMANVYEDYDLGELDRGTLEPLMGPEQAPEAGLTRRLSASRRAPQLPK